MFEGGFGLEWHRGVARAWERLHPEMSVRVWGDPRIEQKVKPRILRGDPPDLVNCLIPVWKLIVADRLYPLDEALNSPAYGSEKLWKDTLTPGSYSAYEYEGRHYAMPSNLSAVVCWYDKRLFRKHNWQVPKTYGEFRSLCAEARSTGLAPIAFQGKYCGTYGWWILLTLFARLVPPEVWYEAQDLKPGAFTRAEFVQASEMFQQLVREDFQPGCMAMTHTESQLEWVNGRALFVFCGLWLKNEMKNALPEGFEMCCFAMPPVEGGDGDGTSVYGGGSEEFFILKDAKRPREALEFLKFMMSRENARAYMRLVEAPAPVRDADVGMKLSSDLQSAMDVIRAAGRFFDDRLSSLFLDFGKGVLPDALADLMNQKETPKGFARRLEDALERIRRNPNVYKPPARGVPGV